MLRRNSKHHNGKVVESRATTTRNNNNQNGDFIYAIIFLVIFACTYLHLYLDVQKHLRQVEKYAEHCLIITTSSQQQQKENYDEQRPIYYAGVSSLSVAVLDKEKEDKSTSSVYNAYNNDNENMHRLTTSPKSGRRFLAMVTSSIQSEGRRTKFYQAWQKAWPELTIVTEYSFLNSVRLRGYALLVTNVLGMHKALDFSESTHQDFDYFIILEDDAFPFENTTWPTTDNNNNNDLDQMLDELEANNGGALFLGSHTVQSVDRKQLVINNGNIGASIALLHFAYGSYAWMISRRHLPQLQQRFADLLQNKTNYKGTTDDDAHHFLQEHNISEYIAVPLMVDHKSEGNSFTWNNKMKYKWEGDRNWWNFIDIWHPKYDKKRDAAFLPSTSSANKKTPPKNVNHTTKDVHHSKNATNVQKKKKKNKTK